MVSASAILGELNGSCKQDFHVRTYSLPAGLACIRFGWPLIDYRFMFENMENSDDDHELRPSGPSRVKARRSHKKSRNGCRYCKQRRIKVRYLLENVFFPFRSLIANSVLASEV